MGVVMTCRGRHVGAVIERKHHCARTQAATLTWHTYYDFKCVYVANMQTSLKSPLVFAHSDVNAFLQSPQYILRTPTWRPQHGRIRNVNGNIRCCV